MNSEQKHNKVQWKMVKFDEFFDMLPNNTLSRDKLNDQYGEYQNIHYGDVLIKYPYCLDCGENDIPYVNGNVRFNTTQIKDGDVIFADTAEDDTVGKCVEMMNVGDRKIVSGLHTYLCRPKFAIASGYLGYFLNSNHYHNQLLPYIAGSKVSSVNRASIARTLIFFPSALSEQCRIASILLSADKVIDSTQKLIAKYKSIKQGMMEDLLKPKEGWKKVKLGEVGEILSGGTPSTLNDKYWSGNVLFVTPLDLGRRNEINTTLRTISEYGVNNSSANLITANSLAVSTRAPIGLMSIVTQNFTTNQGCKSVEFYESQNNMFHFYNMTYNVEYIRRFGQGTTFMEISKTDFSNLEFIIPDLSEQCRIASILSSIDKKIESEEKTLEKYKNIKKGLMEKLLKEEEV